MSRATLARAASPHLNSPQTKKCPRLKLGGSSRSAHAATGTCQCACSTYVLPGVHVHLNSSHTPPSILFPSIPALKDVRPTTRLHQSATLRPLPLAALSSPQHKWVSPLQSLTSLTNSLLTPKASYPARSPSPPKPACGSSAKAETPPFVPVPSLAYKS
jgi:hypothetical protein